MKTAVLGAGVSGLTIARLLKEHGEDAVVYEKESTVGGLARTRFTDGFLYDPYGGHIFNSKNPAVNEWVFSVLPKDKWQYSVRNAKIFMDGRYISYPFELSLCELDTELTIDCVYDFMQAQEGPEPDNFRDWLYWNFGKGIAESYMIPYNEKIWAYPLEKMETGWMRGKMPMPEKKDMLRSVLMKDPTERKMPHSTFYYPLVGGIQTMVNAIANGLDIRCDHEVKQIRQNNGKWIINEDEEFDRVISTIPLPLLPERMELPGGVCECIRGLKYNHLTTVLFECDETDISWLYVPSHKYRSHRVGYQSTLTPNASPKSGRGCAAFEIIGERFPVTKELPGKGDILPEELGFSEVLDSEYTEFAYVIHDLDYRKNVDNILKYFDELPGFYLLGRWGTWNYKNMDMCMQDAMGLMGELENAG